MDSLLFDSFFLTLKMRSLMRFCSAYLLGPVGATHKFLEYRSFVLGLRSKFFRLKELLYYIKIILRVTQYLYVS